ncbi:MAG TPA: penicillin-binding protein 1C, partial [Acidobacteria bacterium]|nr:penicillin-binding protein 1C [Acidobacteriota bacterium]
MMTGTVRRRRLVRLAAAVAAAVALFLLLVPVVRFDDPRSTVLLDSRGRLLSASIAADGQWRFAAPERVPERFARCAVLFEDRRFRWHPGVDPIAIVRAAVQDVRAGRVVSGGSTLTMQVVRLARKGRPRTLGEKLIEAVLAVRLELAAGKDRILALWAGNAPFGGNVVGLEAASWRYFGRGPEHLSWAEAATLAVLPNAPALIHPGRNRRRLLARRNALLARLLAAGDLDRESYRLALAEPLPGPPLPLPSLAPHLLERARRDGYAGQRLRTSLSRELQERATAVVREHAARLAGNGVHNVAALIAEVGSGRVLAYVGNSGGPDDPAHGGWVDLITAPRSTGSTLKPFLYAEMLEAGEVLPTELIPDIPTRVGGFAPENYDHSYSGAVPAAVALARSLNVPAVRMLRDHGVDRFWGELRAMGMTTLFRPAGGYGLTLILGGAETTLWDLGAMYAGLGRTVDEYARGVEDARPFRPLSYLAEGGVPGVQRRGAGARLPGAAACYETLRALLEVGRPGVDAAWRRFASSRRIAWKTGTSWGHRDAWAVGVTPRHVVAVWVGNADGEGRPGLTGHASAAPVLF